MLVNWVHQLLPSKGKNEVQEFVNYIDNEERYHELLHLCSNYDNEIDTWFNNKQYREHED